MQGAATEQLSAAAPILYFAKRRFPARPRWRL
jgi:hypothetical protein